MPGAVPVPVIRVTMTPRAPGTDARALAEATVTALAVGDEVLAGVLVDERDGALVLEGHGVPAAAVVVALAERFGDLPGGPKVHSVWGPGADSAAVRARALSLAVLRLMATGLPDTDDVDAVLALLGDVEAIAAGADRRALRDLAATLTALHAGEPVEDGLDAGLLDRCRFVLDEADAMNRSRQAGLVDILGRRACDLDDLAALPAVVGASVPGFRFYASVALAALDVACVSLDHLRLARAAADAALHYVDGSSALLPDSPGRRLQVLATSAAKLPTARRAAILPMCDDAPVLDLWATIARLALLLAGEDISDGRLPDPSRDVDEIRARCSAAAQHVLGDLGDRLVAPGERAFDERAAAAAVEQAALDLAARWLDAATGTHDDADGEREDLASGALRGEFDIDVLERIVTQALVAIAATLAASTAGALTAESTP
ncbi:MAG: hypothetical protein QOJ89_63 [bacterium]